MAQKLHADANANSTSDSHIRVEGIKILHFIRIKRKENKIMCNRRNHEMIA